MVGAPPEASLRCAASAKASELGGPAREARHLCPQTPDATPGLFPSDAQTSEASLGRLGEGTR